MFGIYVSAFLKNWCSAWRDQNSVLVAVAPSALALVQMCSSSRGKGSVGQGDVASWNLWPSVRLFLFPRHWHSLLKGPEPTKRATRAFFPGPSSWGQIMPPLQTSLGLGGGQGTLRAETVCSGRLGCLQLCARLFYRMTLGCKENGAGIEPQVAGGR